MGVVALRDLDALCEVLVSRTPTSALQDFVTEQPPGPSGARVLGCVLQLANSAQRAGVWAQYAAGAEDFAAASRLYLRHLALRETEAAVRWYQQTGLGTRRSDLDEPDRLVPMMLRKRAHPAARASVRFRMLRQPSRRISSATTNGSAGTRGRAASEIEAMSSIRARDGSRRSAPLTRPAASIVTR